LPGDPPDVLISPRVGRIGWFDFHRAEETIAHGVRAAERNIESIQEAINLFDANRKPAAGHGAAGIDLTSKAQLSGLNIVAQRFLLTLEFGDAPFHDVAKSKSGPRRGRSLPPADDGIFPTSSFP